MNHESNKSPSIGMISTATRTTATVSPISPLTNGNTVQSGNSGFAAALRKLAKQAEDPRGSAVSSESSPVSSPATSHSSPVSTPKRVSLGPILAHSRGHSVPGTPPVVTIAPTKTSNGLWRAGQSQADREHSHSQQDKRTPPNHSPHTLAHTFGLSPSSLMQDPRIQSLSLPGQMHPVVPSGAIPEEYLRALRPFATSDDLRLTSVPLSLDPAAAAHAAAAAAYYHPAYLHHPLSLPRMEESLCLSALRSQFYSVPPGGSFPPIHPSALHMHLPGSRYPGELNHTALAERLQMENELRQREQEREREKEREAGLEREREEERERELDRQKERQRERQQQMARAAESHYLAELQARRAPLEDRPRPGERLTPNRLDKAKDLDHPGFQPHKTQAVKPGLHPARGSIPHPMPSLVPSHLGKHHAVAGGGGFHGALAAAMMTKRAGEEQWLAPPRGQGQEMESHGGESRRESHRANLAHQNSASKDAAPRIGAPPPLISPKTPHQPTPPTTLWNPASLLDTPTESRRKMTPPIRPPPGLTRAERAPLSWGEKPDEGGRRRADSSEKYPPLIGGSLVEASVRIKAEQDRGFPNLYQQHFYSSLTQKSPAARDSKAADGMLVFDDVLQQHRRLVSKLDLEEKRRKEARDGGFYYDLNDSYDESDEEEVKAHLRRVTEQPPLKLDTTSEKMEFLRQCGLGTLAQRDDLLERKKRKRRRMLRERSPSPQEKRKISRPTAAARLTTPFTADDMDNTPELEAKKDFLNMFSLSHVSPQQRRGKVKTEELLKAIQKKTVTLDTLRYNSSPLCRTPPVANSSNGASPSAAPPTEHSDSQSPSPPHKPKLLNHNGAFKPSTSKPPPLAPHQERALNKKMVHNGLVAQKKEAGSGQNGRSRPWERFTPEAFAQHFHQAVLHSTHHTPEHKGVSPSTADFVLKTEDSGPQTVSPPKPHPVPPTPHLNGHHSPRTSRQLAAPQEQLSEEDGESSCEEEDEEDEVEAPSRKWSGIEAIFHAYQEHVDEWSIERQVLHSQCKRLESQNLNLTRTAEQLSLSMGELVSQKQKMREERERLQAQLEHFRRCLTLPSIHWGKGQVNQHAPR